MPKLPTQCHTNGSGNLGNLDSHKALQPQQSHLLQCCYFFLDASHISPGLPQLYLSFRVIVPQKIQLLLSVRQAALCHSEPSTQLSFLMLSQIQGRCFASQFILDLGEFSREVSSIRIQSGERLGICPSIACGHRKSHYNIISTIKSYLTVFIYRTAS